MALYGRAAAHTVWFTAQAHVVRPDVIHGAVQVEVLQKVVARGRKRGRSGVVAQEEVEHAAAKVDAGGAKSVPKGKGSRFVSAPPPPPPPPPVEEEKVDLQALLSGSSAAVDMDAVLSVLNEEDRRRRLLEEEGGEEEEEEEGEEEEEAGREGRGDAEADEEEEEEAAAMEARCVRY
jgi:hypothetical protein